MFDLILTALIVAYLNIGLLTPIFLASAPVESPEEEKSIKLRAKLSAIILALLFNFLSTLVIGLIFLYKRLKWITPSWKN